MVSNSYTVYYIILYYYICMYSYLIYIYKQKYSLKSTGASSFYLVM